MEGGSDSRAAYQFGGTHSTKNSTGFIKSECLGPLFELCMWNLGLLIAGNALTPTKTSEGRQIPSLPGIQNLVKWLKVFWTLSSGTLKTRNTAMQRLKVKWNSSTKSRDWQWLLRAFNFYCGRFVTGVETSCSSSMSRFWILALCGLPWFLLKLHSPNFPYVHFQQTLPINLVSA